MEPRHRYFDMVDFLKDWDDVSKLDKVEFYWGYDDSIKVQLFNHSHSRDHSHSCVIIIGHEIIPEFYHGLEDLKIFIEKCLDNYSASVVYQSFHNFYPLLKENNCKNIKAELKRDVAILSCDLRCSPTIFTIRGSKRNYGEVKITETRFGNSYDFYTSPNDVPLIQSEFFGNVPNNKACRQFWKQLQKDFPYLYIKESKGLHCRSFYFSDDAWLEVTLYGTGVNYSLRVCCMERCQELSYTFQDAQISDFDVVDLEEIVDALRNNHDSDDEYRRYIEEECSVDFLENQDKTICNDYCSSEGNVWVDLLSITL
jgi:hypothetical protein